MCLPLLSFLFFQLAWFREPLIGSLVYLGEICNENWLILRRRLNNKVKESFVKHGFYLPITSALIQWLIPTSDTYILNEGGELHWSDSDTRDSSPDRRTSIVQTSYIVCTD